MLAEVEERANGVAYPHARPEELAAGSPHALPEPPPSVAASLVAVLFAAAASVGVSDLARVLGVPVERVEQALSELAAEPPTGLAVQRAADQVLLVTAPHTAPAVERYLGAPPPVRLSRAALEALAIVAYRQPVTRGEIEAVRGVNSDSAVSTLLARGLVAEVGRRESAGRPALLATTPELLQYLGLPSLDALPPLPRDGGRDGGLRGKD